MTVRLIFMMLDIVGSQVWFGEDLAHNPLAKTTPSKQGCASFVASTRIYPCPSVVKILSQKTKKPVLANGLCNFFVKTKPWLLRLRPSFSCLCPSFQP